MSAGNVLAGIAAALVLSEGVCAAVGNSKNLLRPPGAQSEKDFLSRCIKCGKCIEACPYVAIRAAGMDAGASVGTPYIDARNCACAMCEDFPCVNACPTDALRDCESRDQVNMGYAYLEENICIAFKGMRCEVCYRACPLIDEAITLTFEAVEGDEIHAKFIPVINTDVCTGCGLCVQRCVIDKPRVAVRIVTTGEQERKGIDVAEKKRERINQEMQEA